MPGQMLGEPEGPAFPGAVASGDEADEGSEGPTRHRAHDEPLAAALAQAGGVPADAPEPEEPPLQRLASRVRSLSQRLPEPRVPCCAAVPELNLCRKVRALPRLYCAVLGKYPGPFLLLYIIILSVIVGVAWRPLRVNTDLTAFQQVAGEASRDQDVYLEALKRTRAVRNQTSLDDRLAFQLEIFYQAKQTNDHDASIFSEAVLRDIRDFEQQLRGLAGWQRMCGMVDPRARFRCEPGESLGNYLWPRRLDLFLGNQGFFRLVFDGTAMESLPVPATLTYLSQSSPVAHDPWKFLPQTYAGPGSDAAALRSVFTFTAPSLEAEDFSEAYTDFVSQELYQFLLDKVEQAKKDPEPESWDQVMNIKIFFRGDQVDDHEVRLSLEHDMKLAIGALVFALLVTYVHLQSIFLSFMALLILCCATVLGYIIVPIEQVSLASFLVVFILFGLGGNTFFKMQDLWRRMELERAQSKLAVEEHLAAFYKAAARQLFPIFATALTFSVHLLTLMRPLREFGLYMGTCMVCRGLLTLIVFVPAMLCHEQAVRPFIERRMPKPLAVALEPTVLQLPLDVIAAKFIEVARKAKIVLLVTLALVLVGFIAAVAVAATRASSGLPEVFGPSQQRSAGRPVVQSFSPVEATLEQDPPDVTMCEPWRETLGQVTGCGLHWCNAQEAAVNTSQQCSCFLQQSAADTRCSQLVLSTQLSGSLDAASTAEWSAALDAYIRALWPLTQAVSWAAGGPQPLPPLVFEHWESGATYIEPLAQMPAGRAQQRSPALAGADCAQALFCHCGERVCSQPSGFSAAPGLQVPASSRRLGATGAAAAAAAAELPAGEPPAERPAERRLSSIFPSVAAGQHLQVIILYGITPPLRGMFFDGTPSWSFDSTFQPQSPWSQRAMLSICADVTPELKILETDCWVTAFRDWLIRQQGTFPVQRFGSFDTELQRFRAAYPAASAAMWLNEDDNLEATSFTLKVSPGTSQRGTLQDRQRWLDYVEGKNNDAATTASQAWATSQAWVEAEAYVEALASTWWVTLASVLVLVVVGLVYTMDLEIIGMVICIAITACVYLSFFMYCIFQWSFGPWELTSMTVFLTYSVEPLLRIGQDFLTPPAGSAAAALRGGGVVALAEGEAEDVAEHAGGAGGEAGALCDETGAEAREASERAAEAAAAAAEEEGDEAAEATEEKAGEGSGEGELPEDSPEFALREAIQHQCGAVFAGSLKLLLCGIMLLPCDFQLFSRLGAVAVLASLIMVPCTLLLLPAAILLTGRTRREPDAKAIWRSFRARASCLS